MIGFIQGKVLDTDGKKAILLTESGIGYEINYGYFAQKDSSIGLFIHHHISENDQSLWGFNSLSDKKLFELLKTVNKVGSSKAYPLVSVVGSESVIQAIMFDQPNVLSQAPGIGKKMAEQIILSLKDKIDKFQATDLSAPKNLELDVNIASSPDSPIKIDQSIFNDVMLALESLGYKDAQITSMVKQQLEMGETQTESIIKHVLREI